MTWWIHFLPYYPLALSSVSCVDKMRCVARVVLSNDLCHEPRAHFINKSYSESYGKIIRTKVIPHVKSHSNAQFMTSKWFEALVNWFARVELRPSILEPPSTRLELHEARIARIAGQEARVKAPQDLSQVSHQKVPRSCLHWLLFLPITLKCE